ncbi:hypothetical protein B7C51_09855 [Paenibacillus larvae subsp. pulvifaciens]|uniref:Uncharacterized protein n=1 Tax=Paenibacillus larvae subsp. pulvifaciens TaxID=1477 RepID=A0A1V0US09_9BACL|nr:hypothetical protein [Paenibacillus larvae]ARF68069.1 hypothetical protein B7C51_09855 [Paenibacillus larvae subsp. pulvifaciens]
MDTQLITKTIRQLHKELSPEAAIVLDQTEYLARDLAEQLSRTGMPEERKIAVLGCYIVLQLALERHSGLQADNPGLTKRILDGDYLLSFYYDFAILHKETGLTEFLASVNKNIQIQQALGLPLQDRLLYHHFCMYLAKQSDPEWIGKAM